MDCAAVRRWWIVASASREPVTCAAAGQSDRRADRGHATAPPAWSSDSRRAVLVIGEWGPPLLVAPGGLLSAQG